VCERVREGEKPTLVCLPQCGINLPLGLLSLLYRRAFSFHASAVYLIPLCLLLLLDFSFAASVFVVYTFDCSYVPAEKPS
jgi:hypothetical protein